MTSLYLAETWGQNAYNICGQRDIRELEVVTLSSLRNSNQNILSGRNYFKLSPLRIPI